MRRELPRYKVREHSASSSGMSFIDCFSPLEGLTIENKSMTVSQDVEIKEKDRVHRIDYDGLWKDLIKRFFWNLLEMALPDLYADADTSKEPDHLDKEFTDVLSTPDPESRTSPHFVDYVVKVPLKNGGEEWLILHIEIQSSLGGGNLPVRMHHYKCLIFAHYKKEPVALAIITDKRPKKEALSYSHSHYGTKSVYEYNNLVIADLDEDELLRSNNPIALAFYAAKVALKAKAESQRYTYLRTLLDLLAELGWSREDKKDLVRFIERIIRLTDKELKRQYWEYRQQLNKEGKIVWEHWLKDIEEEVVEQRGFEKGKEEMAREMARSLLASGVSPDIIAQSAGLSVERVRALMN